MAFYGKRTLGALAFLCITALASCSPIYQNHGYVPPEEDLNALVVGVDSRATVDDTIGAPTAEGMVGGGDYYYVRSWWKAVGPFRPEVIKRRIVAISFKEDDTIANIEEFDLKDGQIIPMASRITDNSVVNKGFLQQLLGNVGQVGVQDVL